MWKCEKLEISKLSEANSSHFNFPKFWLFWWENGEIWLFNYSIRRRNLCVLNIIIQLVVNKQTNMVAFFHFRFDVLIINKLRHNYVNIPRRYGQEHTYPNKIVNQKIWPTRRLCNHAIFPIFTTQREVLVTEIVEVGKIGKVVSFFPKTFSWLYEGCVK